MSHPDKKVHLVLDSGAFSGWKLGHEIDVGQYSEYCLENADSIDALINLDVIPAKFGKVPTMQEVEESAQASWRNLKYMESKGLHPWPVFHQGEDFAWLERMIAEGYEYICISPDNGKNVRQKQDWLDLVFTAITDREGYPVVKTHGLAVTSVDLMLRYPWASVDSATWIQVGGFGSVFVPRSTTSGEFDYSRSPYTISMSRKARSMQTAGNHFNNLGQDTQKRVLDFFEQEGYSLDDIAETFEARSVVCTRVLHRIEKAMVGTRFRHHATDMFAKNYVKSAPRDPAPISNVDVYFALSCAAVYSDMLTVDGLNKRLFSYFILRDKEPGLLDFYVRTGCYPMGKCWKRWVDPGDVGALKDPPVLLPRTDRSDDKRKADPIRKIRNWKR